MTNWLRKLETAWFRRHVDSNASFEDGWNGRQPVCVITGASEGIGRYLANEYAAEGRRLLLVARRAELLDKVADELRRDYNVEVITAPIDLSGSTYLAQLNEILDERQLYVDILVNNAAFGLSGPFVLQDAKKIEALCRLNIESLTTLTRHFLPEMLDRSRGGILNIASIGGFLPGPYQAIYFASKAYVVSLTEALAHENSGRGVRISVATPGPVATRFHEIMGSQSSFYLYLHPVISAKRAARFIHSGYVSRQTIIVPGLIETFNAFAVRYIPHFISTPFFGWFLKRRSITRPLQNMTLRGKKQETGTVGRKI